MIGVWWICRYVWNEWQLILFPVWKDLSNWETFVHLENSDQLTKDRDLASTFWNRSPNLNELDLGICGSLFDRTFALPLLPYESLRMFSWPFVASQIRNLGQRYQEGLGYRRELLHKCNAIAELHFSLCYVASRSTDINALSRRIDRFKLGFQVKFAALALQGKSTWIKLNQLRD